MKNLLILLATTGVIFGCNEHKVSNLSTEDTPVRSAETPTNPPAPQGSIPPGTPLEIFTTEGMVLFKVGDSRITFLPNTPSLRFRQTNASIDLNDLRSTVPAKKTCQSERDFFEAARLYPSALADEMVNREINFLKQPAGRITLVTPEPLSEERIKMEIRGATGKRDEEFTYVSLVTKVRLKLSTSSLFQISLTGQSTEAVHASESDFEAALNGDDQTISVAQYCDLAAPENTIERYTEDGSWDLSDEYPVQLFP